MRVQQCSQCASSWIHDAILRASVLSLLMMVGGCSGVSKYTSVDFVWTNAHRMPPAERIITLDASLQTTALAIRKYVENESGEIFSMEDNHNHSYRLHPQAEEHYAVVQQIAMKQWRSYDENVYRKFEEEEWQSFQTLGDAQILRTERDHLGYAIHAKLVERNKTFTQRERAGSTLGYGVALGRVYSYPMPRYEYREKTLVIFSHLEIYVFPEKAKTRVYAHGYPVVVNGTEIRADYGASIGHAHWRSVDGTHEATAIRNLFKFLKEKDLETYTVGETLEPFATD